MYNNEYKRKAEFSKEAGDQLSKGYKDSAMHCYYYACIQYCKHILKDKFDIDGGDIFGYAKEWKTGSHEVVFTLIRGRMILHKANSETVEDIIFRMDRLKKYRESADYQSLFSKENDVKQAKKFTQFVIDHLTKIFY